MFISPSYSSIPFYEPLPSAFTIIERPMRFVHDYLIKIEKERSAVNNSKIFDLLQALSDMPYHALAASAFIVLTSLTPITIVADLITGIAEICFAYYNGCEQSTLQSIARLKFVVYPVQQLTYFAVTIILPASSVSSGISKLSVYSKLLGFTFSATRTNLLVLSFIACMFGKQIYGMGQQCIKLLPKWALPDGLNIFIEGGASDYNGNKYTEYREADYKNWKEKTTSGSSKWDEVCDSCMRELSEVKIKNVNASAEYNQFMQDILDKKKPQELLGLSDNFTEADLKTAFKKCALLFHPDRNIGNEEEAAALIKCLYEARKILEKK